MHSETPMAPEPELIVSRRLQVGDGVWLRRWSGLEPVVACGTVTAVNRGWADVMVDEGQTVKVRRVTGLSGDRKEAFTSIDDALLAHLMRLLWCPGASWARDRQKLLARATRVANVLRLMQSTTLAANLGEPSSAVTEGKQERQS